MSDGQKGRGGLLPQLSDAFSGRGASSGSQQLDSALRASLAQHRHAPTRPGGSFAAWAALSADRPEAILALFRHLNASQRSGGNEAPERDGKPVMQQAQQQVEREEEAKGRFQPGMPARGSDSARHTETDTDSEAAAAPTSLASCAPQQPQQLPVLGEHAAEGGQASAFAPASTRQLSATPDARPGPSLPAVSASQHEGKQDQQPKPHHQHLRAELLLQLPFHTDTLRHAGSTVSAHSVAADTAYYSAAGPGSVRSRASSSAGWEEAGLARQQRVGGGTSGGGGADTPRSDVSWVSAITASALTLPQTEADLAQLDLREVEALAAEAAELQLRAALALRLAQHRMRGGSPSGDSGGGAATLVPGLVFRPGGGNRTQHGPLQAQAADQGAAQQQETQRQAVLQADAEQRQLRQEAVERGPSAVAHSVSHQEGATGAPQAATGAPQAAVPWSGVAPTCHVPHAVQVMLQLVMLAAAALEACLLWIARAAERASGGVVRLPRALVCAPVCAVRGGVVAAAAALELLCCLAAAARFQQPRPALSEPSENL